MNKFPATLSEAERDDYILPAPATEAEKADSDTIVANFRQPPGLESTLTRSTLLIGSRGSGKTTFIRNRNSKNKKNKKILSFYANLRTLFNQITVDTGAGGQTYFQIPLSDEPHIICKTTAIFSHWLYEQCEKASILLDKSFLFNTFPERIRRDTKLLDLYCIGEMLEGKTLGQYNPEGIRRSAFDRLLEHLTSKVLGKYSKFEILLDRAEDIPYPALKVIIDLLDQRHKFVALVATRPGIIGPDHQFGANLAVPGDHYNLCHLGHRPYSKEWRNFLYDVIDAWVPLQTIGIGKDEFRLLSFVCRDSIRNLLEIVYNASYGTGEYDKYMARKQIGLIRAQQLNACQGTLSQYNVNLKGLIAKSIRNDDKDNIKLPKRVSIQKNGQAHLFDLPTPVAEMAKYEKAIYAGLRSAAFVTLHGVAWHPYVKLLEFEIPPIFVWREGAEW